MIGERVFDWLLENVILWFLVLILMALIITVPIVAYEEYTADKFYLRKDRWTCSASIRNPTTTYIQSGNVLVPITTYEIHCTQWTENKP